MSGMKIFILLFVGITATMALIAVSTGRYSLAMGMVGQGSLMAVAAWVVTE